MSENTWTLFSSHSAQRKQNRTNARKLSGGRQTELSARTLPTGDCGGSTWTLSSDCVLAEKRSMGLEVRE